MIVKTATSFAATAAALAAFAGLAAGPASAYDSDEAPARVERNWTGSAKHSGGTTYNQRRSGEDNVTVTRRDDDGDVRPNWERHRPRFDRDGLDADEAGRIRQAHRESDYHVTLRRDDDGNRYDMPSYRTPSYEHHHRHHWWRFWD